MAASAAVVPTPFRGLRVLLLDNDTESLLDIALKLESLSYKVTTTELATVALSILQERAHSFDLVMADTNMPEMNYFKFIKNAHLIKDFPIILMYSELKKGMVIEAATKGKCFCLKKPICLKNLKNVWQYVYRKSKDNMNIGEFEGVKVDEEGRVLATGDNLKIENDFENVGDGKRLVKRGIARENDEQGEFKRKKLSFRQMEDEENEIQAQGEKGSDSTIPSLGVFEKHTEFNQQLPSLIKQLLCLLIHLNSSKYRRILIRRGSFILQTLHPNVELEAVAYQKCLVICISSYIKVGSWKKAFAGVGTEEIEGDTNGINNVKLSKRENESNLEGRRASPMA